MGEKPVTPAVPLRVQLRRSRLWTHLIRLLIRTLGAENPLLVDLPIFIKVSGKNLSVSTGDLALLDSLPDAQLALLDLQQPILA